MSDLYDKMLERFDEFKPSELPEGMEEFIDFVAQVYNGGIQQWMSNGYGKTFSDVLSFLRIVDNPKATELSSLMGKMEPEPDETDIRELESEMEDGDNFGEMFPSYQAVEDFVYDEANMDVILNGLLEKCKPPVKATAGLFFKIDKSINDDHYSFKPGIWYDANGDFMDDPTEDQVREWLKSHNENVKVEFSKDGKNSFVDEMRKLGFQIWDTGGGCTAFGKELGGGWEALMTEVDTSHYPESLDVPISIGVYHEEHNPEGREIDGTYDFDGKKYKSAGAIVDDVHKKLLGWIEKLKTNTDANADTTTAGHSTIMFFSKQKDFDKAMKDLAKKIKEDKSENGTNGDWQQVNNNPDKKQGEFKTLAEAKEWAYSNVNDYAFFALEVGDGGWLFAADIHH